MKLKDLLIEARGRKPKSFKDTSYGDLTGQTYIGNVLLDSVSMVSLEGAPDIVTGFFQVSGNRLKTLKGGPSVVKGDFSCYGNPITTLEGAPHTVGGDFDIAKCKLVSLKGLPTSIEGRISMVNNSVRINILQNELKIRQENPDMTEDQIQAELKKD